jgi:hypothetical protein
MVQAAAAVAQVAVGATVGGHDVVDLVGLAADADAGAAGGGGQQGPIRWNNNTSRVYPKEDVPDCV